VTVPCNLPDYVERGGEQVWRAPYLAKDATLLGFVLPADQAAIDALLQRDLVGPAQGEVDYRSAHANIVVICADITRMQSTDPTQGTRGYMTEREVSIWCLVADKTAGERLVWYLPYLFADTGRPVAAGREVYGYAKAIGDFDAGYAPLFTTAGAKTTVRSIGLDTFSPKTVAAPLPMVTVERAGGTGKPPSALSGFAAELAQNLFGGGLSVNAAVATATTTGASAAITASASIKPSGPGPAPVWAKPTITGTKPGNLANSSSSLVADMVTNPSLVFLKQFRDATCPTKACYQAIVEAPLSIDPLSASYAALDPALFSVTVEDWPSHPIATELGIAAGTPITPARAFEAKLTYDVLTGLEVWKALT
jgi:hypothetical protein